MYKLKLAFCFIVLSLVCDSQEYNPNATYSGTETDPCKVPATTWYLGGNIIAPQLINMPPPPPDAPVSANNPIYNDVGTCNNYDFVLKANNNLTMWIKPSTKVGISESNPSAKFEVLEKNPLTLEPGGNFSRLITSFRGITPAANDIKHNNWMYRVLSNQPNGSWQDYALHDGVSIGSSNLLPGTNTLTWWERLPGESAQKWGDQAQTHLKIGPNFMQIMEQPNAPLTSVLNLNVNGGNAFEIFDQSNQKINFQVKANGSTYIGAQIPNSAGTHANALLSVDGKILAKSIFVNIHNSNWADYVFEKDYKLLPLMEVERFVNKHKHLPNVPSAKDLTAADDFNLSLSDMHKVQMEKIEELYLYIFQQQKEIENLKRDLKEIKTVKNSK
jgi:hypothetical protein